ncbi:hypothetical protein EK904_012285 [Melospiza melodia maxima]|nr:hypothetical protein EK904_012285 [Melospiza melodia maxima]
MKTEKTRHCATAESRIIAKLRAVKNKRFSKLHDAEKKNNLDISDKRQLAGLWVQMARGAVPPSSIPAQLFTSIPCYFLLIISCCSSPGGATGQMDLQNSSSTGRFFLPAELKESALLCFCPSGAAASAPGKPENQITSPFTKTTVKKTKTADARQQRREQVTITTGFIPQQIEAMGCARYSQIDYTEQLEVTHYRELFGFFIHEFDEKVRGEPLRYL